MMVATTAGETTNLSNARGGGNWSDRGEGGGEGEDGEGSGERTWAAREAAPWGHSGTCWGGGGDACDGRTDDGANGEEGGSEEGDGVADHTCN